MAAPRAFLTPKAAPPLRAPNPRAFPPAISAGRSAAKGKSPPFCLGRLRLLLPLHRFFLRTIISLIFFVREYILSE